MIISLAIMRFIKEQLVEAFTPKPTRLMRLRWFIWGVCERILDRLYRSPHAPPRKPPKSIEIDMSELFGAMNEMIAAFASAMPPMSKPVIVAMRPISKTRAYVATRYLWRLVTISAPASRFDWL